MRKRLVTTLCLLLALVALAQSDWASYQNKRFGYSLRLPAALQITNRAVDGSGITWQTGTVRVQASGLNNPYLIKPHEYFGRIEAAAADRVVEENNGLHGKIGWWQEILYTKDGRRIHQKTFISGGSINTLEVSYAYRYRKQKERVAKEILATFEPGDLGRAH